MSQREIILTKEHADAIRVDIESVVEGWFAEGRIDWEDLYDRLEGSTYDLGEDLNSPALKRIRQIVRETRKAMT